MNHANHVIKKEVIDVINKDHFFAITCINTRFSLFSLPRKQKASAMPVKWLNRTMDTLPQNVTNTLLNEVKINIINLSNGKHPHLKVWVLGWISTLQRFINSCYKHPLHRQALVCPSGQLEWWFFIRTVSLKNYFWQKKMLLRRNYTLKHQKLEMEFTQYNEHTTPNRINLDLTIGI